MKSLDDIIAAVQPEAMREALQEKRGQFMKMLADAVVLYEVERDNPRLKGQAKKDGLKPLEEAILKWQWAIDNIDGRLNRADGALHGANGANRAARRRAAKGA